MNKVILDQLNKLGLEYNKEIFIPKKIGYNIHVGDTYKINDIKDYLVEVLAIDGNNVRLNGVAIDNPTESYYKVVDRSCLHIIEKVI